MSKQQQQVEEEREKQRRHDEEMRALDGAQQQHHDPRQIHHSFLDELKESPLQEGSKELLRNLVSPDFIFAYFDSAEVQEFKYKLLVKRQMFFDLHPAQECDITGADRRYINDDPNDDLEALSAEQKIIVDQFFEGVWARVTRAKGMKQQEILQTSISQNYVERGGNDDGSGGGILGRWRD